LYLYDLFYIYVYIYLKGQAGRIGIVGGSLEYTGAPYFSATAALRCGADLAHVFCSADAAGPIKVTTADKDELYSRFSNSYSSPNKLHLQAYSPELIVHPILDSPDPMTEMKEWLPRLHALLLGPGLGRRAQTFATLQDIIQAAMERNILLVFDADALFYLNENFEVIRGYKNIILTPNIVEFIRLYGSVLKEKPVAQHVNGEHVKKLSSALGVTILCKGQVDVIACGDSVVFCDIEGSPRRCGGQGDILSGAVALLYYWAFRAANTSPGTSLPVPPSVIASWGAAAITRTAMCTAFARQGRSTLTSDVLMTVGQSFSKLFER